MTLESIENTNLRFKEIITFLLTAISVILIGFLLSFIPNHLDESYILANFVVPLADFVSERSEKLQYMICTVSFPVLYLVFHFALRKVRWSVSEANVQRILSVLFIAAVFGILWIVYIKPFYLDAFSLRLKSHYQYEFVLNRLTATDILFAGGCGVLCCLCLYYYAKKPGHRTIDRLLFLVGLAFVLLAAWRYVTKTYIFDGDWFTTYHFDAYFYPVYKVYSGQTPLIDFKNLYGFYPYFLAPILALMGGATMYHFSLITAALVAACFLSIFFSMTLLLKNRLISTLCTIAVISWMVEFPDTFQGVYYLQYVPQRLLFPSIFLLLCSLQLTAKKQTREKWLKGITFLIVSLSLLWNPDTGVVIAIAYPAFLIYRALTTRDLKDKNLYRIAGAAFAGTLASVVGALLILLLITFARTGQVFQFADLLYGPMVFYQSGFYMLRMPLIHEWILLIVLYAVALAKSMKDLSFMRTSGVAERNAFGPMYFLLSVMGLGLFSYYQGRSHDCVFTFVCWPGFVLLALFAQEYLEQIKTIGWRKKVGLLAVIVILSSLSAVSFYHDLRFVKAEALKVPAVASKYQAYFKKDTDELTDGGEGSVDQEDSVYLTAVMDVIHTFRRNQEPLNLVMFNAAEIYSILDEPWVKKVPATVDWFERADCENVIESIREADSILIIDPESYDVLWSYFQDDLRDVLQSSYQTGKRLHDFSVFIPKSFGPDIISSLPSDLGIQDISLSAESPSD